MTVPYSPEIPPRKCGKELSISETLNIQSFRYMILRGKPVKTRFAFSEVSVFPYREGVHLSRGNWNTGYLATEVWNLFSMPK